MVEPQFAQVRTRSRGSTDGWTDVSRVGGGSLVSVVIWICTGARIGRERPGWRTTSASIRSPGRGYFTGWKTAYLLYESLARSPVVARLPSKSRYTSMR